MSVEPTTTEGRVAIGTWAKLGHDIPGHKVLALLDALDEAEASATRSNKHANDVEDRVLGLIERAEKAETALDRVRDLADTQQTVGSGDIIDAISGDRGSRDSAA
ncbi:hypothetical protein [Rhodococcus sp. SJ-2]